MKQVLNNVCDCINARNYKLNFNTLHKQTTFPDVASLVSLIKEKYNIVYKQTKWFSLPKLCNANISCCMSQKSLLNAKKTSFLKTSSLKLFEHREAEKNGLYKLSSNILLLEEE